MSGSLDVADTMGGTQRNEALDANHVGDGAVVWVVVFHRSFGYMIAIRLSAGIRMDRGRKERTREGGRVSICLS